MKIHEYQAKGLFAEFGISIPKGKVATTATEAGAFAAELGEKVVIKAQVHAGGRGKAGGVKITGSYDTVKVAGEMLGTRLKTHQTGPEGVPINSLLVEETLDIDRELYLAIVIDSASGCPMIMASEAGGMDIEEVAANTPEKIITARIDPGVMFFQPFIARKIAFGLNLSPALVKQAVPLISGLCRLFQTKDCSMVEINPLVVTKDGRLLALDAKINFDDNALYRHKKISAMYDESQEDILEVEAKAKGIENYIKLDGDIANLVNGAGMAMATMDTLKLAGGNPANFLDIGTINDPARVVNAFKILTADPGVKAVLVNIFGGMTRVDVIAEGVVEAFKQIGIKVPVVVRLAGTNLAEGEKILEESGLDLIRANTFQEAAEKAVAAAAGKLS